MKFYDETGFLIEHPDELFPNMSLQEIRLLVGKAYRFYSEYALKYTVAARTALSELETKWLSENFKNQDHTFDWRRQKLLIAEQFYNSFEHDKICQDAFNAAISYEPDFEQVKHLFVHKDHIPYSLPGSISIILSADFMEVSSTME